MPASVPPAPARSARARRPCGPAAARAVSGLTPFMRIAKATRRPVVVAAVAGQRGDRVQRAGLGRGSGRRRGGAAHARAAACRSRRPPPASARRREARVLGGHLLEQPRDLPRARPVGAREPRAVGDPRAEAELAHRLGARRRRPARVLPVGPKRAPRSLSSVSAMKLSDGTLVRRISSATSGEGCSASATARPAALAAAARRGRRRTPSRRSAQLEGVGRVARRAGLEAGARGPRPRLKVSPLSGPT